MNRTTRKRNRKSQQASDAVIVFQRYILPRKTFLFELKISNLMKELNWSESRVKHATRVLRKKGYITIVQRATIVGYKSTVYKSNHGENFEKPINSFSHNQNSHSTHDSQETLTQNLLNNELNHGHAITQEFLDYQYARTIDTTDYRTKAAHRIEIIIDFLQRQKRAISQRKLLQKLTPPNSSLRRTLKHLRQKGLLFHDSQGRIKLAPDVSYINF